MKKLIVGLNAESTDSVAEKNTAANMGSGSLSVYATPAMIALMENASTKAVEGYLPEDSTTVGTKLDVRHCAATPIGHQVTARAELIEVDRRKLTFRVEAFDECEKIGEGIHERFIVDKVAFLDKTKEKQR